MNTAVFCNGARLTTCAPSFAIPAPTIPPINAWDDDEGRPSHAVRTDQKIARSRPANTSPIDTTQGSMILAISLATFSGSTANAMKCQNAAQITACHGCSTRVATTVAIELAAS